MKRKKKKSVLKKQNIKGYQRFLSLFSKPWVLGALLLIAALSYLQIFGLPHFTAKNLFSLQREKNSGQAWTLLLINEGEQNLSDQAIEKIEKKAQKLIRAGDEKELKLASQEIHALGFLASVLLRRTRHQEIEISYRAHKPLFVVSADKLRYLSDKGQIFGDARKNDLVMSAGELPYVSDLFKERTEAWVFYNNNTLKMDQKEVRLVDQLLNLGAVLRDNNIIAEKIIVDRYRGFSLVLKDTRTEVILGNKDFSDRVMRLATVTQNLEKKGIQAERIELDYEGKAFIKERKI